MLVYTSRSALPIEADLLKDIFTESRKKNQRDNITGFLATRSGYFLQLLEGPKAEVLACYKRIEKDPRHRQITLQGMTEIKTRLFSSWSMGFVETNEIVNSAEEMLDLFDLGRAGLTYTSATPLEVMLRVFSREAKVLNI